eukprot:g24606.t1
MRAAVEAIPSDKSDTGAELVSHAVSEAARSNRRVHRRVRLPAYAVGSVLMGLSMWWVYTSWTSQAAAFLLIRDCLRSFGCLAWLCAVLPSDRFGSKALPGSLLMKSSVRRWVHFQLLKASGAFKAASSIAGFLGNRSKEKIMESARNACRYISMGKILKADMADPRPNVLLQALSTPCGLQEMKTCHPEIHSWHDDPESKWEALQAWRTAFKAQHQREPRLWIDKYCIDQTDIEASLVCLPVYLASCHTLLIIAGSTFLHRLWCMEEVFVFLQMNRPLNAMEVLPICDDMEERASNFRVQDASCSLEKDREKMLATVEAGCESYEVFNDKTGEFFLAPARPRAVRTAQIL